MPKEIGNLVNLTGLGLSNNNLTELPEEICNLVNLTELYLDSDISFTYKQKEWIEKIDGLEII